jgi:prepilin-type N-terminal cleavage/methylation domain-containing protein
MILPKNHSRHDGFTLLEVAIASAVLAIALFTLIGVCANGIKIARMLDRVHVDATSLAAEFSLSNRLDDLDQSGDFGQIHPGYQWLCHCEEVGTNGLFRADFTVLSVGDPRGSERHLSVLLFRPDSIRRMR